MLMTVDGLVTRTYPAGDHDRLIHIITPDRGRLSVMVKGAQAKNNRMGAISQLFTYGNYELYRKGDMYWLRGGSVNASFYGLTGDLSSMALAAYLCDVASDMTDEGEGEGTAALLRMLLNALYALNQGGYAHTVIKAVFELRAAALAGFAPNLMGCAYCGEGYPENSYLDIMNGRVICADCQTKLNRLGGWKQDHETEERGERRIICPMSASTLAAVRYALTAPDKKIFSFVLKDKEEEMALERVAETYLLNQLERGFDTLNFYHSVKE